MAPPIKELFDAVGGGRIGLFSAVALVASSLAFSISSAYINQLEDKLERTAARLRVIELAQQRDDTYHAAGNRYTEKRGESHERDFRDHQNRPWHPGAGAEFAGLKARVAALEREK